MPVEDVKRFIDIMALHRFNRLQMHLTDNIGWRVEIRKYPDLTRLASNRDYSGDKGGFYTQENIRDLVRYAADRHITIVPEIEMPFHAGAAINACLRLGINPVRVADLSLDELAGHPGRDRRREGHARRGDGPQLEHRKRLKAAGVNYRPLDASLVESVAISPKHLDNFANNRNIEATEGVSKRTASHPASRLSKWRTMKCE